MPGVRRACHAWGMDRATAPPRFATPSPADQPGLETCRAEEQLAWQALVVAGQRLQARAATPAEYRRALLAWRAARAALDVALVSPPHRPPPAGSAVPTQFLPSRPGRRPHAKRAWWRPAHE